MWVIRQARAEAPYSDQMIEKLALRCNGLQEEKREKSKSESKKIKMLMRKSNM